MYNNNIKKIFVRFLKEKKIYLQYHKNVIVNNHKFRTNIIEDYILNDKTGGQFMNAFPWKDTKEGYDFWYYADKIWTLILKKK